MKRTLLLLVAGLATLAVAAPEKKSLYDYYLTLPAETLRLFLAKGKPLDAESKKTGPSERRTDEQSTRTG